MYIWPAKTKSIVYLFFGHIELSKRVWEFLWFYKNTICYRDIEKSERSERMKYGQNEDGRKTRNL